MLHFSVISTYELNNLTYVTHNKLWLTCRGLWVRPLNYVSFSPKLLMDWLVVFYNFFFLTGVLLNSRWHLHSATILTSIQFYIWPLMCLKLNTKGSKCFRCSNIIMFNVFSSWCVVNVYTCTTYHFYINSSCWVMVYHVVWVE